MKLKLLAEYLQTGDKSLQTEHWQHVVQVLENLELRDQGMTLGTLERYVTHNTSTVGTSFTLNVVLIIMYYAFILVGTTKQYYGQWVLSFCVSMFRFLSFVHDVC